MSTSSNSLLLILQFIEFSAYKSRKYFNSFLDKNFGWPENYSTADANGELLTKTESFV